MFKISKQQMGEFSRQRAESFEQRMVGHLGERFPLACVGLTKEALVDKVKQAVVRAAVHRITAEKDVCRFIELATALGEGFDVDPKLPWVGEILDQAEARGISRAVERVYNRASEQIARASGGASEQSFSERAPVGDPVAPCPENVSRRVYSFSS